MSVYKCVNEEPRFEKNKGCLVILGVLRRLDCRHVELRKGSGLGWAKATLCWVGPSHVESISMNESINANVFMSCVTFFVSRFLLCVWLLVHCMRRIWSYR